MTDNNIILTVTGSDSTGEAGVQADIRTITELGGRAVSAITSITVQNTVGIQQFHDLPAAIVGGQMEAIMNDVQPSAVKIGMLRRADTVAELCRALLRYRPRHVVYHPVVRSARGERLMDERLALRIRNELLPLCTMLVITRADEQLLPCQHLETPCLLLDGEESLHGEHDALSTALTTLLAQGVPMRQAMERARAWVSQQLLRADKLQGRGQQLYNDFLSLVDQHLLHRTDVQYYAEALNVSARYLGQVTRRVVGRSPKAIIDERMVDLLERRLANTSSTLQEIAYESGFSSQAQLSRFFKKMKGVTPSEWRSK